MNNMCEHCINSVLKDDKLMRDDTDECRKCMEKQRNKKKSRLMFIAASTMAIATLITCYRGRHNETEHTKESKSRT